MANASATTLRIAIGDYLHMLPLKRRGITSGFAERTHR